MLCQHSVLWGVSQPPFRSRMRWEENFNAQDQLQNCSSLKGRRGPSAESGASIHHKRHSGAQSSTASFHARTYVSLRLGALPWRPQTIRPAHTWAASPSPPCPPTLPTPPSPARAACSLSNLTLYQAITWVMTQVTCGAHGESCASVRV